MLFSLFPRPLLVFRSKSQTGRLYTTFTYCCISSRMLRPVSSSTFQNFPTSPPCYGHSTGYQLLLGSDSKFGLWPMLQPTRRPLTTYRTSFRPTHQARPLRSAATGRLAHPASHATVSRSSRLRSFSTLAPQW